MSASKKSLLTCPWILKNDKILRKQKMYKIKNVDSFSSFLILIFPPNNRTINTKKAYVNTCISLPLEVLVQQY